MSVLISPDMTVIDTRGTVIHQGSGGGVLIVTTQTDRPILEIHNLSEGNFVNVSAKVVQGKVAVEQTSRGTTVDIVGRLRGMFDYRVGENPDPMDY